MATYKTSDLLKLLTQIISEGYEYIDIYEIEADDDCPAALSFEAIESEYSSIDYDSVESSTVPADYDSKTSTRHVSPDDPCGDIIFTYKEIFTLAHAVDNALEYLKECSKDPSYSKDVLSEIKSASIDIRNLQAKIKKLLSHYKIS